jgi:hypothetical protein
MSNFFIVKSSGGGWPPVETQKLKSVHAVLSFTYNNIAAEPQMLQSIYAITFLNYA